MKPAAVVVVLSLGILSGGASARADSPGQFAEPLPLSSPFAPELDPDHWSSPWLARPPIVAEGADLWYDYRGACIEHDLYRPRFLARPQGEHQRRPLLSAIGNWLDHLFAGTPPHRHADGQFCEANNYAAEESGFVPTHSPAVDPRAPSPAPFLAPVPLGEIDPPRVHHAPMAPVPVQVIPAEPTPAAPTQAAPTPAAPTVRPPANEIPKLTAPRGPIVELVPEPAISAAEPPSTIIVPKNRIPRTGDPLPRNSIPQ